MLEMVPMLKPLVLYLVFLLGFQACQSGMPTHISRQQQDSMYVRKVAVPDASMEKKILPYKQRLEQKMNDTVNFASHKMSKDRPEGSLGNLVTESLTAYLKEKGYESDLSLITAGGLRIPELPAGLVTVGKVFELQPFDNEVVIVTIRGDSLQKLLNFVSARGGDPVNGVRFTIRNKQAEQVKVGNRELRANETYKLITSDYLANGGDNLYMLAKPVSYVQTGLAFRDALIDYWKLLRQRKKPLEASLDGRIKME